MPAVDDVLRFEHLVLGLEVLAEMSPDQLSHDVVERAFTGLVAELERWEAGSCEGEVSKGLATRTARVAFRLLPRWPDALLRLVSQHYGMDGVSELVMQEEDWGIYGSGDCDSGFVVARREHVEELGGLQEVAAELIAAFSRVEGAMTEGWDAVLAARARAAAGQGPAERIRLEGDCYMNLLAHGPTTSAGHAEGNGCPHEATCEADEIDCALVERRSEDPSGELEPS